MDRGIKVTLQTALNGRPGETGSRCGIEVGGGGVNSFRLALNGRPGVERANVLGG